MRGATPAFFKRLYQSGVSLSWSSDYSIAGGVGFRVRVSRASASSVHLTPSPSTVLHEYAASVHTGGSSSNSKSISVPDGSEIVLQPGAVSSHLSNMNLAWILSTQHPSQTFKVDILDMDMRSTDTVTLSASGWSLVLSGDGVPAESTYYVHGPMTVSVATGSASPVDTFDIRVHNSDTNPTVGTGTCGGSGALPPGYTARRQLQQN